ncbi:MlaC/ttg2D family ABC transporter substrate-binding protein [Marinobacterium aestuariivivens]|uniref:Phospholipid-binding protein MlaC n=1 Tax=Marinobacterium aestuariivivens TaxID=1698799 RepID=A0ABW1ZWB1_9GAMM
MKELLKCFALIGMLLAPVVQADPQWDAASKVVEKVTADMVTLIEQGVDVNDDASFQASMATIEQTVEGVIDFGYIAQRVMGKYYRRASDEERARFAEVFRQTMVKTYTKALAGFEITRVELVAPTVESPEPDKQVVTLDVYSGNGTKYTLVNYMLERDGQWQLVNVIVDGINLRLTFTNQFADMAERSNGNVTVAIDSWQSQIETRALRSEDA